VKQKLTGTGKHMLLQPQNGIMIKAIQKQELHTSNILQKGTSSNQHKKKHGHLLTMLRTIFWLSLIC